MKIKDISIENRPRERLEKHGSWALSDAEILAIILQKGTKNENVIDLSNRLISKYDLSDLSRCSLNELQKIKGIGKAKACQIMALFEFNKRFMIPKNNNKPIKCAKDVYEYIYPKLVNLDKEHFIVLHLDTKNRIIKEETVSIGTLNSSIIHPREVFKSAIKESANSVILVHNHPSGETEPSIEDKEITDKLFNAGELLSIKVLDHIIIGNEGFYSFKNC
jgi:DNA repair protein RadC